MTITSRPYKPHMACERCVFSSGLHLEDCPKRWVYDAKTNSVLDRNKWIFVIQEILARGETGV